MKKNQKTIGIFAVIIIASIIMYFVWKKQQTSTSTTISPRIQEYVNRVPYATREKIVGVFGWYMKNSNPYIWKEGKIFNTRTNEFDPYNISSIELKVLNDVLWDIKTNYGLIDDSTEWWIKSTMKFTIQELTQSLNYK